MQLIYETDYLAHHGILGQKWGFRRYQNPDGSLTPEGRKRYIEGLSNLNNDKKKIEATKKMYDKFSKGKNIDEKIHLGISAASAISTVPIAILSGGAAAVIPAANTFISLYNAKVSREASQYYKNGKDICDEFLNGTLETNVIKS